jgi:hypothetical protein
MMKGKVTAIPQSQTQFGPMYNVEVDGRKYGFGKYPPKNFAVGDYVEFNVDSTNPRFPKMDYKTVKVIPEPADAPAPAPRTASGGFGKSYGGYNDDKRQEVISRQAARNSAIAAFAELRALDALPVPAKTAKAADKFDLYIGIIDEVTDKYFNYSLGIVTKPKAEVGTDNVAEVDTSDNWEGN